MSLQSKINHYKYYLRHLSGIDIRPGVRVVIFGQGRSGSTLLESLIASTGHFTIRGEIFKPQNRLFVRYPLAYLSGMAMSKHNENFIFHLKGWHLTGRKVPVDPGDFLRSLAFRGWKVIYIRRENKFGQTISKLSAVKRGGYHKRDNSTEQYTLQVDINEMIEDINKRARYDKEDEKALQGLDYLQIDYETDLLAQNCHQKTIDRILDYLLLERKECSTDLRKINARPYHELIDNYAEVKAALDDRGLGHWMDSL